MRFVLSLPGTPRPKKTHGESCHACAAHESVARTGEDVGEHREQGTRRQGKHRHDANFSFHPQPWKTQHCSCSWQLCCSLCASLKPESDVGKCEGRNSSALNMQFDMGMPLPIHMAHPASALLCCCAGDQAK
jgi:hypothetical protein